MALVTQKKHDVSNTLCLHIFYLQYRDIFARCIFENPNVCNISNMQVFHLVDIDSLLCVS